MVVNRGGPNANCVQLSINGKHLSLWLKCSSRVLKEDLWDF